LVIEVGRGGDEEIFGTGEKIRHKHAKGDVARGNSDSAGEGD
jgi:hypothetical protein